jgi:hypothetical protein
MVTHGKIESLLRVVYGRPVFNIANLKQQAVGRHLINSRFRIPKKTAVTDGG